MVFIHIYGARAIFLLFYDNQDTEFESTNINTEKEIKGYMGQRYPYPKIWVKNIMVVIHIYGARVIFVLFYDHQDTESESQYFSPILFGVDIVVQCGLWCL